MRSVEQLEMQEPPDAFRNDRQHKEARAEAVPSAARTPGRDRVLVGGERRHRERENPPRIAIGHERADEVEPAIEAASDERGDVVRHEIEPDRPLQRRAALRGCKPGRRPAEANSHAVVRSGVGRTEEEEQRRRGRGCESAGGRRPATIATARWISRLCRMRRPCPRARGRVARTPPVSPAIARRVYAPPRRGVPRARVRRARGRALPRARRRRPA